MTHYCSFQIKQKWGLQVLQPEPLLVLSQTELRPQILCCHGRKMHLKRYEQELANPPCCINEETARATALGGPFPNIVLIAELDELQLEVVKARTQTGQGCK